MLIFFSFAHAQTSTPTWSIWLLCMHTHISLLVLLTWCFHEYELKFIIIGKVIFYKWLWHELLLNGSSVACLNYIHTYIQTCLHTSRTPFIFIFRCRFMHHKLLLIILPCCSRLCFANSLSQLKLGFFRYLISFLASVDLVEISTSNQFIRQIYFRKDSLVNLKKKGSLNG